MHAIVLLFLLVLVSPLLAQAAPWNEPIMDIFAAIKAKSIFPDAPAAVPYVSHIWRITRPGSQFDWATKKEPLDRRIVRRKAVVGSAACVVVEATQLGAAPRRSNG